MEATTLKPLPGLRVLVTRPRGQAHALSEKLRALGALTFELPTIEIAPPQSYTQLDKAIHNIKSYDWIIFTSVHGVQFFTDRLATLNVTLAKDDVKVAAVGPATAAALKNAGRNPTMCPNSISPRKSQLDWKMFRVDESCSQEQTSRQRDSPKFSESVGPW